MTDLYFIRHGQATFGNQNYDQLSEVGVLQSSVLSNYLIDMEAYFPVVYSGNKKRQIDTATAIVSRLNETEVETRLSILPDLNEFDVSAFLQYGKESMIQSDPAFLEDLKKSLSDYRSFQNIFVKVLKRSLTEKRNHPSFENFKGFKNRVHAAFKTIMDESAGYKKVAVVTSGGVLALLMQKVYRLSDRETIDWVWRFYNASITVLNIEGSRLELKLQNSVVHFNNGERQNLLTYV